MVVCCLGGVLKISGDKGWTTWMDGFDWDSSGRFKVCFVEG